MQPNCEDYIFREFVPDDVPQLRKLRIEALSTSSDVLAARFEEADGADPLTSRSMAARARVSEPTQLLAAAVFCSLALAACQSKPHLTFDPPLVCRVPGPVVESVFLIGDAGAPELPEPTAADPNELVEPVLVALARDVAASVETVGADRTAVVVLGDNVYPAGMPPPGDEDYARASRVLDAQIAAIGEARGFFILGNHDWDQGEEHGLAHAKAQSDYLSSKGPNISLHPPNLCPGPEVVEFGNHLHFVFVDIWAAIYQIEYPDGPLNHCQPPAGTGALLPIIDVALHDKGQRRAIMVAHPPLLTSGPHGGYFRWQEHVFPLRVFNPYLWIPLPIIGSIFPIARMYGVTDTDQMGPLYEQYIEGSKVLFSPSHPTLVASGHEHSLQVHIDPTGVFHAVSGAGSSSKVDYVRDMRSDLMSLAAPGYMRLDAYADSTLRLNVFSVDENRKSNLVFSTCVP